MLYDTTVLLSSRAVKQVNEFTGVCRVEPYGRFFKAWGWVFDRPKTVLSLSIPMASSAASFSLLASPPITSGRVVEFQVSSPVSTIRRKSVKMINSKNVDACSNVRSRMWRCLFVPFYSDFLGIFTPAFFAGDV